jgi:hypothetical protein
MNVLKGNFKSIDMNKKEKIKNKWFMRNDISLREAWNNILDEYAEYVAQKAYMAGAEFIQGEQPLIFTFWYKQFKAKENE